MVGLQKNCGNRSKMNVKEDLRVLVIGQGWMITLEMVAGYHMEGRLCYPPLQRCMSHSYDLERRECEYELLACLL